MKIIGLTGSIGMGKSTTADMFRKLNIPVWDADKVVHDLYAPGGAAVDPVGERFPEALLDGGIDRTRLSAVLAQKPERIAELEALVHPLVAADRQAFLARCRRAGEPLVVLDIPLLFETGQEGAVDAVVVVTAAPDVQAERVLGRPGMNAERLAMILARQLPDDEKRARADHIIFTDRGLGPARDQVEALIQAIGGGEGLSRDGEPRH